MGINKNTKVNSDLDAIRCRFLDGGGGDADSSLGN